MRPDMAKHKKKRLSRNDWMRAALEAVSDRGVHEVKVSLLAKKLGATTGSFYWHFKNRHDLLEALLDWWETEMTDAAINEARQFDGTAEERILGLMRRVVSDRLARYDIAIWQWALSDRRAKRVYGRVVKKRFDFACWMFEEAGFSKEQAKRRGRMMVVYLMGDATLIMRNVRTPRESVHHVFEILTAPASPGMD